ncbi:hypothetical protein GA0115251_12963 [Streptomyces sp. TverLS-915]|nr:hypothetical protein GA0115251_12963 [Streptomyces sp. TverLS-915]
MRPREGAAVSRKAQFPYITAEFGAPARRRDGGPVAAYRRGLANRDGDGPVAVQQDTSRERHEGGCTCADCPAGARNGHQRAVAAFVRRREELADGKGLPAAVAHSAGASRQWVSDELAESARLVAERGRSERLSWLHRLRPATLVALGAILLALLLVQGLTALGAGWTTARSAGLVAAVLLAALLAVAAHFHRARGGVLAPVVGEDQRLSTSRTVAACWILFSVYAVLVLAGELAGASGHDRRTELLDGLELGRGVGLLTVLAASCAVAVLVHYTVGVRVRGRRLQKVRADRPRAADLLTDDSGHGSFTDSQYVLVHAAALVFCAVRLARRPEQLPDLPWALAVLALVSAATYLAGKATEGGGPVIHSVVRTREAGDLDAPIRTGDDIEIRGAGFLPAGAETPQALVRMAVRIGQVQVHVPLIPVPGGFTNPTDTLLTVPIPAEVEPGRVTVQVITAAGVESNEAGMDLVD